MKEDSVIDLEGQTIVIINSEWKETVIHIGEAFSGRNGYYANCLVFKVSEGEWDETRIYDSFLSGYEDDIRYADDEYKQAAIVTLFDGDKEDIDYLEYID